MSDISDMIKIRLIKALPYSHEYEASLFLKVIGQVDKENVEFHNMEQRLRSIILDTVHKDVIDKLDKLVRDYLARTQGCDDYQLYKAYYKVVEDLQKLIRELRGL